MNLYLDYKNRRFVKNSYETIVKAIGKEVNKAVLICKNGVFNSWGYRFFKNRKVYEFEYVLHNPKNISVALKYLRKVSLPITLTLVVDKKLTNKVKKQLLNAGETVKIIDASNELKNEEFYKTCKYVIYKTVAEDNILKTDLIHLYKFYETEYQCKHSSCLCKNLYVDSNGEVYFCPYHLENSRLGNLNNPINYLKSKEMLKILNETIEFRNNCKNNCKYFNYCAGGCPLEKSCNGFIDNFNSAIKTVDEIINNGADLRTVNYTLGKIVIKDSVYGE